MRTPPVEVMLGWPKPNYVDPVTRGSALIIIQLIVCPLALICLALRLWVRMQRLKRCWWDDWLMVAAAVCCCGVTVSVILATQLYGWNIHVWDLTTTQMVHGRQVSIAGQTIFVFASGLSKLSILASYLRIAVVGSWFRRLTWYTIIIVTAAIPSFLLLLWFQCRPASSYWNISLLSHDCIAEGPPLMGQTIVTVLTDFIVYILPMPTLWGLKLPALQRISLMVLFGFGSIVVVAGCMRTYWIHHVEYDTYDVTWEGFDLWIWAAVEVNLGVICGCAPVLKTLVWPSKAGSSNKSRTGPSNYTIGTSGSAHWGKKMRASTLAPMDVENEEGWLKLDNINEGVSTRTGPPSDSSRMSPHMH